MGHKDGFDLIRCSRCRTIFTTEFPADSEPLYEDLYQRSRLDDIPDIVRTRTTEIVNTFNPWRGHGRLLDVGCGVGHFLEAASEAGWQPEGLRSLTPLFTTSQVGASPFTVGSCTNSSTRPTYSMWWSRPRSSSTYATSTRL
jgi:hypothetical protein